MRRERPHPLLLIVFLLGISALITGCETIALHENASAQTIHKPVYLFRGKVRPSGKYQEVGVLTDKGALAEQDNIEAKFVRKARQAGADGIIIESVPRTDHVKDLSDAESYLYKATLVSFVR